MNLDPVTVRIRAWLPAGAFDGEINVTLGTGFREEDEEDEEPPPPHPVNATANAKTDAKPGRTRNRLLLCCGIALLFTIVGGESPA